MPLVEFRPSGKKINVDDTVTLAEAARRAGVTVELPCGGKGTCGRCLVNVINGAVVRYAAPPEGSLPGSALACKTAVGPSDCVIEVPERDLTLEDRSDEPAVTSAPFRDSETGDALVERLRLKVPQPRADDGLSDLDRTAREIGRHFNADEINWGTESLRELPNSLRADSDSIDITFFRKGASFSAISVRPVSSTDLLAGVAVDLGTTTVSVRIHDMESGKELAGATGYNEQIHCGEDVIGRINYARKGEGLGELREKALATINRLIGLAAGKCGLMPRDLQCAVVSGNTVMTHLLLGITPEYLRLDPYTPAVLSVPETRAHDAGIDIHPSGLVFLSPSVGSYVGGDITAGLLCTEMTHGDEIGLFIDVGTNGEIVLGNRDFLMACACSAGPAFEGGGIGCGMRAMEGAINSVTVDPSSGLTSAGVIGDGKARGICGSGMIDLLSELFLKGVVDPSGRFLRDGKCSAVEIGGRRGRYLLVDAKSSHAGDALYITELDIENIMRAKAAVFSACALLLDHAGLGFADISRIYVAGGFGRYLNIGNAVTIGLLPDIPLEKYSYLGNSSLEGSVKILLSKKHCGIQSETARRMTYINLSTESRYSEQYTAALFLPHTDMGLFPGVRMKRQDL